MKTAVYEIRQNGKWKRVRATSIKALNDWGKENGVSDWHMVGMMSRSEMEESKTLMVVA